MLLKSTTAISGGISTNSNKTTHKSSHFAICCRSLPSVITPATPSGLLIFVPLSKLPPRIGGLGQTDRPLARTENRGNFVL